MKKLVNFILILFAGALLFEGFQCSSPEMTTAKLAYRNGDLTKAQSYIDKELQKNPTNCEALVILAEIKQTTKDYPGAAKAILEAEKNASDEKMKNQVSGFKNKLWVDCYNQGVESLNQGLSTKNNTFLEDAIKLFNTGIMIKSSFADFYQLLGTTYEAMNNNDKAIESYNKYTEMIQKELKFAKEKNIRLNMPRNEALNILGNPVSTKGVRYTPKSDSIQIDILRVNSKDVYLYSTDKGNDRAFKITGWRVNPPEDWSAAEKEQPLSFNTAVFQSLAQIYYTKKNYDKATEAVRYILLLDPLNSDANNFLVGLYEEQGKKEEAVNYASELVKTDPNNKYFKLVYGDMLLKTGKFDDAIQQYEQALKLDPNFEDVYVNLAIAYKNKVYTIQKKQQDEVDKDNTKKLNVEEYAPLLRKAADLFEKVKKQQKYSTNYQIYAELAEVYYVLNETDKLKLTIAEMEALDALVKPEDKSGYYLKMIKIYDKWVRNEEKFKIWKEKFDQLEKQQ